MVNHLKDAGTLIDSTQYANNGTASGGAALVGGGMAGGAYSFDGINGAVTIPYSSTWNGSFSNYTVQLWIKLGTPQDYHGAIAIGGWGSPFNVWFYANEAVLFRMDTAGGLCQVSGTVPLDNAFHQLAWTYDAGISQMNAYIDGVGRQYPASCSGAIAIPAASLSVGGFTGMLYLQSTIDELRISANVTRSAGWIVTEYNNQSSPATFYSLGAQQSGAAPTVGITITTAPGGLSVTVDGSACTAPCARQWTPGSPHTIATTATQAGTTGTQYLFASWSDGGAVSHPVTAPSTSATYTASFTTQFALTTAASPAAGGSISPASGWYGSGAVVAVNAAANGGYQFSGFSGALSGTVTPQNLTMNGPAAVTANFTVGSPDLNTYYTYDLLDHLTQVTMPRSTGAQTRTFVYDVNQRLATATNPENGTVTYTYNTDGTVATRADAKGQKLVYTYDGSKRVTQVQRYVTATSEDACQRSNFYYDTNPFDGSFSQYSNGRLTVAQWGATANCTAPYQFTQMYSYTPGGLVTKKRLTLTKDFSPPVQSTSLDTLQTYDNEGKVLTVKYPDAWDSTGLWLVGPTYTYTYDTMARPIKLTDNQAAPVDWAKDAQYGPSGALTQITYGSVGYTETRTYNSRQQLTRMTAVGYPWAMDMEYRYSPNQNNGQITQQKDWLTGEEVSYAYDSLQRLVSAATTGPEWGQGFTYDGFGNLTGQSQTKGQAPQLSALYDPATNRVVGGSYDANGNMLNVQLATLGYDVDNRVWYANVSGATEYYAYGPDNKRIWKQKPNLTEEIYFYGISGQKLGTYRPVGYGGFGARFYFELVDTNLYFGSKMIMSKNGTTVLDRLGSVRNWGGMSSRNYPYGEEQQVTVQDREKFATYYRDGTTGLDYAQNRYYANTLGRFTSPDPYVASGGPTDPQSWNKYAYTRGDPVNRYDPRGLQDEGPPRNPDLDLLDFYLRATNFAQATRSMSSLYGPQAPAEGLNGQQREEWWANKYTLDLRAAAADALATMNSDCKKALAGSSRNGLNSLLGAAMSTYFTFSAGAGSGLSVNDFLHAQFEPGPSQTVAAYFQEKSQSSKSALPPSQQEGSKLTGYSLWVGARASRMMDLGIGRQRR